MTFRDEEKEFHNEVEYARSCTTRYEEDDNWRLLLYVGFFAARDVKIKVLRVRLLRKKLQSERRAFSRSVRRGGREQDLHVENVIAVAFDRSIMIVPTADAKRTNSTLN